MGYIMKHMTDSEVLDRIMESAKDQDFWKEEVQFEELRTAVKSGESRIYVNEGATSRWAELDALNFVTMAIWDPKMSFSLLREEAPNNGDDLTEGFDALVNATSTHLKEDKFEVARTRGFVKQISELASTLAGDAREENYTYRVYRLLSQSEVKLGIGTNPLGPAKEFYARGHPIRITTEEEQQIEEQETESAAQASW